MQDWTKGFSTTKQNELIRTLAKRHGYSSPREAASTELGLSTKRLSKSWLTKGEASELIKQLLAK